MKLPEYDNRPGPGEPLYEDVNAESQTWEDIKFTFLTVTLSLGTLIGIGAVIVLLLLAIFN